MALVAALVLGGGAFWLFKPASLDGAPTASAPEATSTPDSEPADPSNTDLSNTELAETYGDSVYQLEAEGCGGISTGTAWVVDEQHLVTNWHVVASDPNPDILSRDGQRIAGEVIGGGFDPDVAVVRADGDLSAPVSWSATESLAEGQDVVALGYPAPAGDFTVTPGSVLSFQMDGSRREAIRMDGLIDKGNSGGPALTRTGQVAGVVTEAISGDGALQIVPIVYTAEALESAVSKMIADPQPVEADCGADIEELPDDWDASVPSASSPQNYGDDPSLDALYDDCEAGDMTACDTLYVVSPFGSDYETLAISCGNTGADPTYGSCELQEAADAEQAESEAEINALVERCDDGSMSACDDLGLIAEFGTEAYDTSETCGGRYPEAYGACVEAESEAASLEQLVDKCQDGDMQACDDLSIEAPYDSEQSEVGESCGGRYPEAYGACVEAESEAASLEQLVDKCQGGDMQACDDLSIEAPYDSEEYEVGESCGGFYDDAFSCSYAADEAKELQGYYDDCAEGDMAACDNAWLNAPPGSDIETFGGTCGGRHEDASGTCELQYGD